MDFANRRVLIMGMARSGLGAAQLLASMGACLTVYDRKSMEESGLSPDMIPWGTVNLMGKDIHPSPGQFDFAVVSPGIPLDNHLIRELIGSGTEILGEIELAFRLKDLRLQILAITGTNGKTTTTSLVADILKRGGMVSVAAGNIGVPLTSIIQDYQEGMVSLECSSFQLETIKDFHPLVSGILNITPDHLDRHKTMAEYARIKGRIFMNQTASEYTILNGDDPLIRSFAPPCKVRYFSLEAQLDQGIWVEDGCIKMRLEQEDPETVCRVDEVRLRGRHNLQNVLCAVGMTRAAGVSLSAIRESLACFESVRHRLEEVRNVNGVLYVNDSKGTNTDSTIKALESFADPVVLIAGGRDKGSDYSDLARLVKQKVKGLVLMGEARSLIRAAVEVLGYDQIFDVQSMEEAVDTARTIAESGEVVLLSPACASYDMFRDYEARGDEFCAVVASLQEGV